MSPKPLEEIIEELKSKHQYLTVSETGIMTVPLDKLVGFMQELRDNYHFNYLTNVTAADYLDYFEVIYNVSIVEHPHMLHIKARVERDNPVVPSMVPLWGGAIWQEREVYDLMGIKFESHPDLRRILLDDDWEGHPLRKDYQWEGGREE
ncbi:NADH-quinone oxidoreductase subunit C [Desulforamulus ferrireducens]|uniref:NADH-quinone oxidoreductase n=1 Tax=Desulforamulus ferrireducens TaxID=1833852 RepID=A0A1S6IXE2_9FIRM|nr:NADH-quinone oxidoreductase subunit C [Desulforamulus ferrireducens]AQS59418.1 NADH dehydrogenase [Desulforamulus ferrireducens]